MEETIQLVHGDGGVHTNRLIHDLFYRYYPNDKLLQGLDAAILPNPEGRIAFTTDSFIVKPIFFPGGDIGKLSICGTINDLVVSGAKPLYLSVSFIIEEGFPRAKLEKIVRSMSEECKANEVMIVTGDTKVAEKGSVDGVFINTTGIGKVMAGYKTKPIEEEDCIILSGGMGEHGTAIAIKRYGLKILEEISSDCSALTPFLEVLKEDFAAIKIMRDPTRGGLATVLHEFSSLCGLGINLQEEELPIKKDILAINKILGLDPMYLACEGRMVLVVKKAHALRIVTRLRTTELGANASIIGTFVKEQSNNIIIINGFGGRRRVPPMETGLFPRIC